MNDCWKLVGTTIRDCAEQYMQTVILSQAMYNKFMHLSSPEEMAKDDARRQKERDRLAAIEAAKTPAQRMKEKQERCDHEFTNIPLRGEIRDPVRPHCMLCGLKVSASFARGYAAGHRMGHDAGYHERGQHDTDQE